METARLRLRPFAGLHLFEGRGPEVELGYTLGRRWWGRGYATEAADAWRRVAYGHEHLLYRRVVGSRDRG